MKININPVVIIRGELAKTFHLGFLASKPTPVFSYFNNNKKLS